MVVPQCQSFQLVSCNLLCRNYKILFDSSLVQFIYTGKRRYGEQQLYTLNCYPHESHPFPQIHFLYNNETKWDLSCCKRCKTTEAKYSVHMISWGLLFTPLFQTSMFTAFLVSYSFQFRSFTNIMAIILEL